MDQDPARHSMRRHSADIVPYLIFTILTCGLFNFYWNYRQMEACNELVGREEFNFGLWFVLVFLTCGIYYIYYQYKMGLIINEIQEQRGLPLTKDLPILGLVVSIIGLGVVVDVLHQREINGIVGA